MASELQTLLVLQAQDTVIDQLVHRRAGIPERATLDHEMQEAADLKRELDVAQGARIETQGKLSTIEGEVAKIDERIGTIKGRIYGSEPIGPKEAQAMTEEVEHLETQKSSLEDEELVLMEALEPKAAAVAGLEQQARDLGARLGLTKQAIADAEAVIDSELEAELAKRLALAGPIDPDLLARYESLRPKLGGVAVAKLDGERCSGCHLTISPAERNRVRNAKDGEIVLCEECDRILVVAE